MKSLFNNLIEKYEKNERLIEDKIKQEQLTIEKKIKDENYSNSKNLMYLRNIKRNYLDMWKNEDKDIINGWNFRSEIKLGNDFVYDKLWEIYKSLSKEKRNIKQNRVYYYAETKWFELIFRKMKKEEYDFIYNPTRQEIIKKASREKKWNYKNSFWGQTLGKNARGWEPLL
ncbi:MAG: hypothetical protein PF542_01595 [Nanoarchaeota archaeon]|jgi:hypothetical protein|nr:hypothetical protein [Nanoarchaeota archaeon]